MYDRQNALSKARWESYQSWKEEIKPEVLDSLRKMVSKYNGKFASEKQYKFIHKHWNMTGWYNPENTPIEFDGISREQYNQAIFIGSEKINSLIGIIVSEENGKYYIDRVYKINLEGEKIGPNETKVIWERGA